MKALAVVSSPGGEEGEGGGDKLLSNRLVSSNSGGFGGGYGMQQPALPMPPPPSVNARGNKNLEDSIAGEQIQNVNFEFMCEKKKCRAPMQISGQVFRDAMREDLRKKGFKGKPRVGVECDKCGHIHNLVAPPGFLDDM